MTDIFNERFSNLNEGQKKAASTIEGPVMVIAGPGTGKTEVLAARITKILKDTDANPSNILCLTYTDAGTVAMRSRLHEFIGKDAYKVDIYTFHAFCNMVIQENLDYFGKRELTLITELERAEFLEKLVDSLPVEHPLYRVTGYFEVDRLTNLFLTMKRESFDSGEMLEAIDHYIASLKDRDEYIYKRANSKKGIKAGDVKEHKIADEAERMNQLKAAVALFDDYVAYLTSNNKFDYEDLIFWVKEAFTNSENIKATYQERYLYVLVDEYQDTNGTQNEIINLLTDFWDSPNIFIVGDDDQSIFRFQGANLRNIMSFYRRHKAHIEKVTITKNYRSSQKILNTAMTLIEENEERLTNEIEDLNKVLEAANPNVKNLDKAPRIFEYYNTAHEEAGIVDIIEKLYKNGQDLNEVAIIYRYHSQAANIIKILEQKGIPLNVKESTDVLTHPFINSLINILLYIEGELSEPYSKEDMLFKLLHYEYFGLNTRELAIISALKRQASKDQKGISQTTSLLPVTFRELMQDTELLSKHIKRESIEKIESIARHFDAWIAESSLKTVPEVVESVINEGGILSFVMNHSESTFYLRLISTFFNFVKSEASLKHDYSLKDLLSTLNRMLERNIKIPIEKMTFSKSGVNFVTAHSSKGLEFEYVFVIGCQRKVWDVSRRSMKEYKYPDTLTQSVDGNELEESRRLMYVALTRAKKQLVMTYSARNLNEKELEMSQFLAEIIDGSNGALVVEKKIIEDSEIQNFHMNLIKKVEPISHKIIDKEYLDEILKDYALTATHLNKYLKCPVEFYFESILRVPQAKNEYMAFGTAIHYALEHFYRAANKYGNFGSKETLVDFFKQGMHIASSDFTETQYKKRLEYGIKTLESYYDERKESFHTPSKIEYSIWKTSVGNIPIRGKLDKLEIIEGNKVNVIDYKTGNATRGIKKVERPSDKDPIGGDYWRQLTFYKLLLKNDPKAKWSVEKAIIDFVEPNSTNDQVIYETQITEQDEELLKTQIREVYAKIMNHEFTTGCNEEDCRWCNFIRNEITISME